ncbi:MAG: hypothetical protein ACLQMF_08705 [Rectinemataceae bacterium]
MNFASGRGRRRASIRSKAARAALVFLGALASGAAPLSALDLSVLPGDVRIEARAEGGYDLFVRAKPDIASILLTETTKDPAMKADNFAYRATERNDVNGAEKRLLNGKLLPPEKGLYSLISSTVMSDPTFGRAFRILIPPVVVYGYPWSRSGSVAVGKGTFVNIRAFQKPYADYTGAFADNPYEITVMAITREEAPPPPLPPPTPPAPTPLPAEAPAPHPGLYDPATVAAFTAVAKATKGKTAYVPGDGSTSDQIAGLIDAARGENLDLVVCLDTTGSMDPYFEDLRARLGPLIREKTARFKSFRVGLMLFKDYWPDEYITKKIPFMTDIDRFVGYIKAITPYGGGDIPEAVHEGLYAAATEYDWKADKRLVILVGDAPPHPIPRGKITFEDVVTAAAAHDIEMDVLVEPIDFKGNK